MPLKLQRWSQRSVLRRTVTVEGVRQSQGTHLAGADRTFTAIDKEVSLGFCAYARQCRPPRTKLHPSTLASSKCRDREWTSGAPEQSDRVESRCRIRHPHPES